MKMWMWRAVFVLALAGFWGFSALAELPASGSHASGPTAGPITKPSTIAPQPSNPADNKPGRIADYNDPCRLYRPGTDTSAMESALTRIFR